MADFDKIIAEARREAEAAAAREKQQQDEAEAAAEKRRAEIVAFFSEGVVPLFRQLEAQLAAAKYSAKANVEVTTDDRSGRSHPTNASLRVQGQRGAAMIGFIWRSDEPQVTRDYPRGAAAHGGTSRQEPLSRTELSREGAERIVAEFLSDVLKYL